MAISRKVILAEVRDYLLFIALGILITWLGISCRNCREDTRLFWVVASFTTMMWIALWKGNSYLGIYISSKISWIEFPVRRFIVGLVATLAYTLMAMYLLGVAYERTFDLDFSESTVYSIIITLIISLFMHGRAFLLNWKRTAIDAEVLKRESIAAKYESLKNQVNPHFLFNSLNALTNLVYEDQDKAVKFINQLSAVYRYVLDTREKEVVPLQDELRFISSYLFLQKIRFEDKLHVELDLNGLHSYVAPLALQMLIENAIKHNVISEDDPLHVKVYSDGDYIIIQNDLQKKSTLGGSSAGVGLENIVRRYAFLSDRKVEISQQEQHFIVKIPVLRQTGAEKTS